MTLPDCLSADRAGGAVDQSVTPRFAPLLRAAKLIGASGEYLCIVRDVSETGVRLRLFHPLTGERRLALEATAGERLPVERVWEREGEAGFRFVQPIDVTHFIAEAGPYPKRPIRIGVDRPARIRSAGASASARIHDLSRQGARIVTDYHLAIGQTLQIECDALPHVEATVCWRERPSYGLVFRQLMSLEDLAVRAFRMQPGQAA
ncbi:PilZ domain-containing protein [Novosphingobium soli]|uniref:PilZ domain-containing protein n=1 Tax=Novosphingobium soli TaxID=574956 RepID=A0ABV6CXN5_9SPHN